MNHAKSILLVEDNPSDIGLAKRVLHANRPDVTVFVAEDGRKALDFLFGLGDFAAPPRQRVPDLILLDLKLPRLDGFEVLRQLRTEERTKYLPIVILTSSMEGQDLVEGYDSGANSYIRKPLDFQEFTAVIQSLSTYWLDFNQSPPEP